MSDTAFDLQLEWSSQTKLGERERERERERGGWWGVGEEKRDTEREIGLRHRSETNLFNLCV